MPKTMPTTFSPSKRSLVRIKAVLLHIVFLCCAIALANRSDHVLALMGIAGASAILVYFVRCESCKSSIYYRAGGERYPPNPSRFLYSARCPYCELKRF
jgi:hypothetical protein